MVECERTILAEHDLIFCSENELQRDSSAHAR